VNFIVDGGDNTDDTIGGALQNFSVENVDQFKIQTQNYKAEYGRSSGGVVTVVTKSGTNDLSGSLFAFGRNDNLNSITESEQRSTGTKQSYSRGQYGGSAGGPIVRDRIHFFGSYEGTRRETNYTVRFRWPAGRRWHHGSASIPGSPDWSQGHLEPDAVAVAPGAIRLSEEQRQGQR
jgi:hypothetical protein